MLLLDQKFKSSELGMSLPELLMTISIAGIVVFGISTFFSDMITMQKRGQTVNSLMQFHLSVVSAASGTSSNPANPSAWDRTIADLSDATGNPAVDPATGAPAMACLRDHTLCPHDFIRLLNLKGRDGRELFYARTNSRGFTMDGRLCNTFSLAPGDPQCPFRYFLRWRTVCVDGGIRGGCVNPAVEIHGDLLYSPGPTDILGGQPLNVDLYKIRIRRGEGAPTNIPIVFSYEESDASGEGTCDGMGAVARRFSKVDDPLRTATVAANAFTLQPGKYECRVEAPAFMNGGNRVTFRIQGGATIATGTGFASLSGGSASISLQASLVLSAATTFQITHSCDTRPSANPSSVADDNWAMGVPVPSAGAYTNVVYTVVTCMKTG